MQPESSTSRQHYTRFLSKLGHELRTPLGSILMLADLLGESNAENLTDKQRSWIAKIHQAGSEMRGLLDEVSVFAKIDGGRIDLYPEEIALGDLVRDLEDKLQDGEVEVAGGLPASLTADRVRLAELLVSLVALARSNAGDGVLRIAPGPDSGLAFAVGGGATIPETAFEPFGPAPPGTPREVGGRLRLPTARALARLLGGELVRGNADGGYALTLYLPVAGG